MAPRFTLALATEWGYLQPFCQCSPHSPETNRSVYCASVNSHCAFTLTQLKTHATGIPDWPPALQAFSILTLVSVPAPLGPQTGGHVPGSAVVRDTWNDFS